MLSKKHLAGDPMTNGKLKSKMILWSSPCLGSPFLVAAWSSCSFVVLPSIISHALPHVPNGGRLPRSDRKRKHRFLQIFTPTTTTMTRS
jgi:hypothetical protein